MVGASSLLHKTLKIWAVESNQEIGDLIDTAVAEFLQRQMGEAAFAALLKRCQETPQAVSQQKLSA
jgi:hypothetical protein